MLYIDTVNVDGTEYGITARGSEYPVACMLGTGSSEGVEPHGDIPQDAMFSYVDYGISAYWMRTGESGAYEYALVLVAGGLAPEDHEYRAPVYPGGEGE